MSSEYLFTDPRLQANILRYHVGESMVASFRHFLRFVDLDSTFVNYGFVKKVSCLLTFSWAEKLLC
jgi:hypothetical protein